MTTEALERQHRLPTGTTDRVLERLFPQKDEYYEDPAAWMEDKLGWVWSKQADICDSVCDNRHTAVQSCHGPGKSYIAAGLAAWWIDIHPPGQAFVVTTAPSQTQIKTILWRELHRHHRKANLKGYITHSEQPAWKMSDGEIVAFGRKPQDYTDPEQAKSAFQGIHARYVLVILDEASGIPEWLWDAVEGLVTNEYARILAIGNPDDPTSQFAKICSPGSGWHVISIDAFETPNFTGERVPKELSDLLVSPIWVEERRKRWGEGSPLWESRVRGRFPKKATDSLIHPDWISQAQNRDLSNTAVDSGRYGVDVARTGVDSSVIIRRRGCTYRTVWSETGLGDTMVVANKVFDLVDPFNNLIPAVIDVIGIGAGVYDRCAERMLDVIPFNSSAKPNNRVKFENKRAEQYWVLREEFEAGNVDIDEADDELAAQLGSIKWKVNRQGRIQIESKEDMKKRGLPSPDRADAMMMATVEDATWEGEDMTVPTDKPEELSLTGDLMTIDW